MRRFASYRLDPLRSRPFIVDVRVMPASARPNANPEGGAEF
jgi:hypothetical protein